MQVLRATVLGAAIAVLAGCSSGKWDSNTTALADESRSRGSDAYVRVRIIESAGAARSHHTATPLPGGKILIVGGHDGRDFLATMEIFDPEEGTFVQTESSMSVARAYHSATRINGPDGQKNTADDLVIIAGGFNGEVLASVEVYFPQEDLFRTMLTPLAQPLYRHGAVPVPGPYDESGNLIRYLPPGNQILLVGGATEVPGGDIAATNSAFLYSFDPQQWNSSICRIASSPVFARLGHTITAFEGPDGLEGSMVLVYGGEGAPADAGETVGRVLADPEVFYVRSGAWTALDSAPIPRTNHRAVQLNSGEILLVGGFNGDQTGSMDLATLFRPTREEISESEFLSIPGPGSPRQFPEVALLSDGKVLVTGGYDGQAREILATVEVFSPDDLGGEFLPVDPMFTPRVHHTATHTFGEVIILGGRSHDDTPLDTAESFQSFGDR
ncbi:MAG: hypothetical protein O7H41_02420 [Planctomycetota bacterium]|nr:hypothetical protein [Planctomycetota bacterium]